MKLANLKDCSKCIHSRSYGSKDSPVVECNSSNYDIRDQFKEYGKYFASRCECFAKKGSVRDGLILDNYLDVVLGGNSEFILHSTKTEQDFEYRLTRVESTLSGIEFVYYLNIKFGMEDTFAGTIYYDNQLLEFKFSTGAKGKVDDKDISVRSLLHVLNKLVKHEDVQFLEILHTGKCSVCGKDLMEEDEIRTGVHKKCKANLNYPEVITKF